MDSTHTDGDRVSTGIDGLDEVLHGGLIPGRSYLVRGDPGTGKTILGFNYLLAGVAADETVLYINLEEQAGDVRENAASLGIDLSGVEFLDLSPDSAFFVEDQSYDVFSADEVDRDPLTAEIIERVESLAPDRVFIDPITQLRYLSADEYQFRKQVMGLRQFFSDHDGTVLFTSQSTADQSDEDLQFLSDGTIALDHSQTHHRTLRVPKFRGSDTRSGTHAVRIGDGGLTVFPELLPGRADDSADPSLDTISSGVPEVDELLGGGVERGTVTILSGATGVGKTTTGTQFVKEAAGRGERSVVYLFEENTTTMLSRSQSVNIPVREMMDRGTLHVEEVEALDVSPQEFAQTVRAEVEREGAELVMIDGISGYRQSVHGSDAALTKRLHTLCRFLKNAGVTVLLIDEVANVTGEFAATNAGVSYLADNIVFLRHLELHGELRKAIGVLKKRTSHFERTLREFEITEHGLKVGEPLHDLRGVLSGTPELVGDGARGG
jgi:circadian clock protein KaiC